MLKALLIFLLALSSLPVAAQDFARAELFGGYQYVHFGSSTSDGVTASGQGFNGWNVSVAYNFKKHLGVVGDLGGSYATISGISNHFYTFTGGPLVSLNAAARVNPFVHALLGGARASASATSAGVTASVASNGFSAMLGGGVDARVTRAFSVRVIQADWLYYHLGGIAGTSSSSQSNNVRISIGLVYRFIPFS
ncbi:MAG TPA: outer membrane beta-barrel protein [Candidatus Aquilonibacter sp.]|nr:outer membrane beta-barrel protein [Candidatus Aquilonibacter sp.]